MRRILFLVSGGGGNLRFFHFARESGLIPDVELRVIGDRECAALEFTRRNKIRYELIEYSRTEPKNLYESSLLDGVDLIVTTWHKILDEDFVTENEGKIVNLHYSLLPAFRGYIGETPVQLALDGGCKFIGSTCHLVNERVDAGRILSQAVFEPLPTFQQTMQLMFRTGCVVLCLGIEEIFNESFLKASMVGNTLFSPKLKGYQDLDQDFWNTVTPL